LRFLSLAPPSKPQVAGVANLQRAWKLRGSGQTGQFPASDARAIIDMCELDTIYEWITIERIPLDVSFNLLPIGSTGLSFSMALPMAGELVFSSDLAIRQYNPRPGIAGEFGSGFAPVAPSSWWDDGPNCAPPGLRLQYLSVRDTGEIRLRMLTIMPRRTGTLKFFADPVSWGRDLFATLSFGFAGRFMPSDTGDMEKNILAAHAVRLRDIARTRGAWQIVRDWLLPAEIPKWILTGKDT
jgi:hypothetical protein